MATEDTATDIKLSTHRSGTLARSTSTTACVWAFAVDYGDATAYVAGDSSSHVAFIGAYVRIDRLEAEL